jgi:hypothetical protein
MTAIGIVDTISLDAVDPATLARFYSAVLDLPVAGKGSDWAQLGPFVASRPTLLFLWVPEAKAAAKDRMHLDLRVDDVAAATARCEAFGATRITDGCSLARSGGRSCATRRATSSASARPTSRVSAERLG